MIMTQFINRVKRLREDFSETAIDAILVSQPENRYYLSGFDGSAGYLLITEHIAVIAVDFRYVEQARLQTQGFDIFKIDGPMREWLPELLRHNEVRRLGLESSYLSMNDYHQITDLLSEAHPEMEIIATVNTVETLRCVKDSHEIELISNAVNATEQAMAYASNHVIKPGISEKEVAWKIEKYIREFGGDLAFPIIVASGPASAMPHAQPSDRPIQLHEPIVVDIGVRLHKYCGDLTRTFWLGDTSDRFEELYNLVLGAQAQAMTKIAAGQTGVEADACARDVISEAGYGQEFGHSLGHGIGLAVHELPAISTSSDKRLSDGMIFTIEPGVYIPGWGGIRIEDDVVLEYGKIRQLSTLPK